MTQYFEDNTPFLFFPLNPLLLLKNWMWIQFLILGRWHVLSRGFEICLFIWYFESSFMRLYFLLRHSTATADKNHGVIFIFYFWGTFKNISSDICQSRFNKLPSTPPPTALEFLVFGFLYIFNFLHIIHFFPCTPQLFVVSSFWGWYPCNTVFSLLFYSSSGPTLLFYLIIIFSFSMIVFFTQNATFLFPWLI